MLKAYVINNGPVDRDEEAVLVFAQDIEQAKILGLNELGCDLEDFEPEQAKRRERSDQFLKEGATEAYIEHSFETLRLAGFTHEDGHECASCELSCMGLEKYAVCPECECCPECGHDYACSEDMTLPPAA